MGALGGGGGLLVNGFVSRFRLLFCFFKRKEQKGDSSRDDSPLPRLVRGESAGAVAVPRSFATDQRRKWDTAEGWESLEARQLPAPKLETGSGPRV